MKPANTKLQAAIEAARAKYGQGQAKPVGPSSSPSSPPSPPSPPAPIIPILSASIQPDANFTPDPDQQSAIELGLRGVSFCLIGPAGSGKTFTTQRLLSALQQADHISPVSQSTKYLHKGLPGILVLGFTNKAIANILKRIEGAIRSHCLTIHKAVEYGPEYYEITDPETGIAKNMMRFVPYRNAGNKLPQVATVVFEESSQISVDLYNTLLDALPSVPQCVFLGDLNQLPPVMGVSILSKMLPVLPIVELRTVYRTAALSPIISLATAIRTNKPVGEPGQTSYDALTKLPQTLTDDRGEHGKVVIQTYKQRVSPETMRDFFFKPTIPKWIESGHFDPDNAMILCPFEKGDGINCPELNRIVGTALAKKHKRLVHEVIARYQKSYFSVGDRILYRAMEGTVIGIRRAAGYVGALPKLESYTLDYWGNDPHQPQPDDEILPYMSLGLDEEAQNLASHVLTIQLDDADEPEELSTAGEINSMFHGWAMTVHKAQGSEWRDVFFITHRSHNTMLFRELVYTAVTRARQNLYIFCEGDLNADTINSIKFAAGKPRIKGETLAEKLEFLRTKQDSMKEI